NVPADVAVTVDDGRATLTTGDGHTVTITAAPGKRRVRVTKDGFTTFGDEVELAAGGRETVTVRLEPAAAPAGPKAERPAAAVLAPENSEWAGVGTVERDGARLAGAAAVTITERRGHTFKASVRAGAVKLVVEGTVTDGGAMTHAVAVVVESADRPRDKLAGTGTVGKDRMTLLCNNPDTGGTARFALKRLPDAGAGFTFVGRWKCTHAPGDAPHVRTVTGRTSLVDWNGQPGTWSRDGGLIDVHFAGGAREQLAIDPDNPNELDGHNGDGQATTWARTGDADAPPKDAAAPPGPAAPAPPPARPADGFVPLFNGRDLTGWKPSLLNKGSARVTDGILILTATHRGNAAYVSEASYGDLHLRAEVQNASHRNKFIAVRAAEVRRPAGVFTSGYFVSCGGETTHNTHVAPGAFAREMDAKAGTQVVWRPPINPVPAPSPGQWFWIDVIAKGSTVTVLVDGQKTYEYTDAHAPLAAGPIRLTAVTPAELRVRRLEVKPVP
ncbi:MAG TPA: DUF1080 domain-containing protein, partial [Gemmataceae bacterium]